MNRIITSIQQHFLGLEDRLRAFTKQGVQVEGWFKGEMLCLLDVLKQTKSIYNFDREVTYGQSRRKADFGVQIRPREPMAACELKAWLVGQQKGVEWGVTDFVRESASASIVGDLKKLKTWKKGKRFFCAFCYANPGQAQWDLAMHSLRENYPQFRIRVHTSPHDFPDYFFIGLVELL